MIPTSTIIDTLLLFKAFYYLIWLAYFILNLILTQIHQNNALEHKSYYCMVCPPVLVRCKLLLRSSGLPVKHEIQVKSYPQIQNKNQKLTYFISTVGYICKLLDSFNSGTITNGKYGKIILQTTQLALDTASRLELSSATTPDGHFSVPKLSRPINCNLLILT